MAVRTSRKVASKILITNGRKLMKIFLADLGSSCRVESFAVFSFAFEPNGNISGIDFGQKVGNGPPCSYSYAKNKYLIGMTCIFACH